jgi:dGTPase
MEVAQIATGILGRFRQNYPALNTTLPSRELLEAICFAHDLGHPPFGHGGERALNCALMTSSMSGESPVGFEGNGQTLRILTRLEYHTFGFGLDLTRRTLLGVLKYPVYYSQVMAPIRPNPTIPMLSIPWYQWKPPKCYLDTEKDVVQWVLEPLSDCDKTAFQHFQPPKQAKHGVSCHKSLDASIMDAADEIAYGVHDFEDGIELGFVTRDDWSEVAQSYDSTWAKCVSLPRFDELLEQLFAHGREQRAKRKRAIGSLVNALISSVRLVERFEFEEPVLKWRAVFDEHGKQFQEALQKLNFRRTIERPSVQTLEYRGQFNLLTLFRAIVADPERLLGTEYQQRLGESNWGGRLRVIADYIGGMTDEYATRIYERLFLPRHGTAFDHF